LFTHAIVAASEKARKELETRACAVCLQQADPANTLIVVSPVT
jgi:hypothetical protein